MTIQFPPVTLLNGTKVSFEEFEKWTAHKQRMHLDHPTRYLQWGSEHSEKMRKIVSNQYAAGTRRIKKNCGAANGQAISITTPQGIFPTKAAVCKCYGIDATKLKKWMSDFPDQFYETNPISEAEEKMLRPGAIAVQTPDGVFNSINSAARHFGVGIRTINTWIRKLKTEEFKYVNPNTTK